MRFVALLCFLVLAAWASLGWKSAAEQRPPEGAFPATVSIVWDFSAIEPATLGGSAEWTSHLALAPSGQARALACLPPKDITFDAKPDEKACLEQAEVFVSSLSEDVALIPGRGSIAATCWRWPEGWVRCDPGDEWQRAFPLMEGDQVYKEPSRSRMRRAKRRRSSSSSWSSCTSARATRSRPRPRETADLGRAPGSPGAKP